MKIKTLSNKCSQAHVETIISFAIFLGFVVMLLFFFNPLKQKQVSYTVLDMTQKVLFENWTINYKIASLKLAESDSLSGENCFAVLNVPDLKGNLIVKDLNGNLMLNHLSSTEIKIEDSSIDSFYMLYASDYFDSGTGSCSNFISSYSFGTVNSYQGLFLENIFYFAEQYAEDYESLREELDLQNDFVFYIYNENGEILTKGDGIFIPKYVEVVARDIPAVAIDKNANHVNIIINIRTW